MGMKDNVNENDMKTQVKEEYDLTPQGMGLPCHTL